MITWTLWILLTLNNGELSVMKSRSFTSALECAKAAQMVWEAEITGVSNAIPVCKQHTDV